MKKIILTIICISLPLFISSGLSTWIISNNYSFSPKYEILQLIQKYYPNDTEFTYNGETHTPESSATDIINDSKAKENGVEISYRTVGTSVYTSKVPINQGSYQVRYKYKNESVTKTYKINTLIIDDEWLSKNNYTIKNVKLNPILEGEQATVQEGTGILIGPDDSPISDTSLIYDTSSLEYEKDSKTETFNNKTDVILQTKNGNMQYTFKDVEVTMEAVAHIGDIYYGTIEKAIDAAKSVSNAQIYVIPEKNPTIRTNCSLQSDDTLLLPYGKDSNGAYLIEEKKSGNDPIAFKNPEIYLKSHVSIDCNVKFINNGTIKIGGYRSGGQGGSAIAGQTCGNYAQISLFDGATLESNGTITSYGFIVASSKNSKIDLKGSLYAPFCVYEHRGGTNYLNLGGGISSGIGGMLTGSVTPTFKCSPFNRFTMPNIIGNLKVNYSAQVYGCADLYASDQHNETQIKIMGSSNDNLIKFSTNAYANVFYNPTTEIMNLDLFGGAVINSLSLSLVINMGRDIQVNVSTSSVKFPISWYYNISLNKLPTQSSATYSTSQKMKILPGGSLTISEGAVFECTDIAVYETFEDSLNVANATLYPTDVGEGKLIVNGQLNVGTLGGKVLTQNSGALLNISTKPYTESVEIGCDSAKADETNGDKIYRLNTTLKIYEEDLSDGETEFTSIDPNNPCSYTSLDNRWVSNSNANVYNITFETNIDNLDLPENNLPNISLADKTIVSINANYIIKNKDLYLPDLNLPNIQFYKFEGWYKDNEFKEKVYSTEDADNAENISASVINGDITLYAKWVINKELKINYDYVYATTDEDGNVIYKDLPSELLSIIESDNKNNNPTKYNLYTESQILYQGFTSFTSYRFTGRYAYYDKNTNELISITEFNPQDHGYDVTILVLYTKLSGILYTFNYHIDGVEEVITKTIDMDELVTYQYYLYNDYDKESQYFDGWYKSNDYKNENKVANPSNLPKEEENITYDLYGIVREKFRITIEFGDGTGHTGEIFTEYILPGTTYTLMSLEDVNNLITDNSKKLVTGYIKSGDNIEFKEFAWMIDGVEKSVGDIINISEDTTIKVCLKTTIYYLFKITLSKAKITVKVKDNSGKFIASITDTTALYSKDYSSSINIYVSSGTIIEWSAAKTIILGSLSVSLNNSSGAVNKNNNSYYGPIKEIYTLTAKSDGWF